MCLRHDNPKMEYNRDSTFYCRYCIDWVKNRLKGITVQNPYPKFQLSDVIYIMRQVERDPKKIKVSLMEALPFDIQDTK
jgi:hypothetical protein